MRDLEVTSEDSEGFVLATTPNRAEWLAFLPVATAAVSCSVETIPYSAELYTCGEKCSEVVEPVSRKPRAQGDNQLQPLVKRCECTVLAGRSITTKGIRIIVNPFLSVLLALLFPTSVSVCVVLRFCYIF